MNSFIIHKLITGRKSLPAFLLFTIFIFLVSSCSDQQPSYSPAPQNGSNIEIDISELDPEVPRFFTYNYKGKKISYFVLIYENKVNSYLDASMSYFPYKMGFSYNDAHLICNYCKEKYPINKIDYEKGLGLSKNSAGMGLDGCYPVKIEGKLINGKYIIPVKLLEKKAGMF